MTVAGDQALLGNRVEKARCRTVVQLGRRRLGRVLELDRRCRVPLYGANPAAIGRQAKAFLVAAGHHRLQVRQVQRAALAGGAGNQCIDIAPAFAVQLQIDGFGGVTQYVAEKFAGFGEALAAHAGLP
ncbi:hypothetical protein D3C77_676060 [compost metagenome]